MKLISSMLFENSYLELVEFYTEKLGLLGGFILSFVENIFPPLPIFAIVIANVTSFGMVIGFLISFVGHYLGAYTVFIFLRFIIKPRVVKKLKKESKILRFERWFSRRSFSSLLIILSLPFFPYFFVNLAAAFSDISKRMYLIALGIGNFFMVAYLSLVGVTVSKALENGSYSALIYPVILVIVAYVTGKIFEKKVNLK
ncbi:MAG: TVP38/TMEM64 family protein [Bacilli bacterium]